MSTKALMPYDWGRVSWAWEDRKQWLDLPFPVEEYHDRIRRAREMMVRHDLDLLFAYGIKGESSTVRYFSNFEDYYGGETVVVIPLSGPVTLITDAVMHGEPMHSGIQETWIEDARAAASPRTVVGQEVYTVYDHIRDRVRDEKAEAGRIGVSGLYSGSIRYWLQEAFPNSTVVDAQRLVLKELRQYKSPREVALMREVAAVADAGLIATMSAVREGVSEHEAAAAGMGAMYRMGADSAPGTFAISSGPRSGFKHVAPRNKQFAAGELVFVDLSSRFKGYFCDNSRHTVVGTPSDEQLAFMEANIQITQAVIDQMKPGVVIKDLAAVAIELARELGVEQWLYFRGHGIGTAVQDLPAFSPKQTAALEPGQVFVFEPMLVRYDFGTACVEDMFAVHEDRVEQLTTAPWRYW